MGGNPISLAGKSYAHGFGTYAAGSLSVRLDGAAKRFTATVGVDDEVPPGKGSVEFFVLDSSHKPLWRSGILKQGDASQTLDLDVAGQKTITLRVADGGDGYDYDHAVWADARFTTTGAIQTVADTPSTSPVIDESLPTASPELHGPALIGVPAGDTGPLENPGHRGAAHGISCFEAPVGRKIRPGDGNPDRHAALR